MVRFHFRTKTYEVNHYAGFYVDDFLISGHSPGGEGEGEGEGEVILNVFKGHRWSPLADPTLSQEYILAPGYQAYFAFQVLHRPEGEEQRRTGHWSFNNIVVNGYIPGSGYNLDAPYVAGEGQPNYRHWGECQGNQR